jgi:hypothetical protein
MGSFGNLAHFGGGEGEMRTPWEPNSHVARKREAKVGSFRAGARWGGMGMIRWVGGKSRSVRMMQGVAF